MPGCKNATNLSNLNHFSTEIPPISQVRLAKILPNGQVVQRTYEVQEGTMAVESISADVTPQESSLRVVLADPSSLEWLKPDAASNRLSADSHPVETITIDPNYLRAKRILDIIFTLLISPFLLLVIAIVAIWIKLDSEGPVLFRQQRYGKDGVPFEFLKFRSMYVNNDQKIHEEKIKEYMQGKKLHDDATGNTSYKYINDPRITKVGRFIRKTSIDELPQFWNVLRGEMSLVGPRPPLRYEIEKYGPREMLRLAVKPGLTGTWQVYGRSRVTFQEMIEMDISYAKQQSIWEDLKLIVLTVPVMIFARGGG